MPRRIGTTRTILGTPFVDAYVRRVESGAAVVEFPPQKLAEELRQGNLDGAFISPWEYVKCYPAYSIVPAAGIVSEGAGGLIGLLYRRQARTLERIAARPDVPSERALAQIVLAEKYEVHPVFQDFTSSWEEALGSADAVLVSDTLARESTAVRERLDLVDEWQDITEFPFVHGFWVVRDEAPADPSLFAPPDALPPGIVRGVPAENDWNALREFYRMAYFHTIIDDLPDLKFTPSGQ